MKSFESVAFDVNVCRSQLMRFRKLLEKRPKLDERSDILPFFRRNKQLAAFMAGRFLGMPRQDRIAFEYALFGDFSCDIVVGNSETATYCFVELEDAAPNSIFKKKASKSTLASRISTDLGVNCDGATFVLPASQKRWRRAIRHCRQRKQPVDAL